MDIPSGDTNRHGKGSVDFGDLVLVEEGGRVVIDVDGIIFQNTLGGNQTDSRRSVEEEAYKLLVSGENISGEERKQALQNLRHSEYECRILENDTLTPEERKQIIEHLDVERLYKILIISKYLRNTGEYTFCLNHLIGKARGEYAYMTLLNVPGVTQAMKNQLIDKLGSQYSFHALADVENLTENDKKILRRNLLIGISPEYAYRALDKIVGLSREQRIELIQALGEFVEYAPGISDLTTEERYLIQQLYFS